jgi:hypothetical protein
LRLHLPSQIIGRVTTIDDDFVGVPVPTGCFISIRPFFTQGTRSSALRSRTPIGSDIEVIGTNA